MKLQRRSRSMVAGLLERFVRFMKIWLRKFLGKASATKEKLKTNLCEVECVLSSCPLTCTPETR